ncbi:mannose-6-phosphate isomerase, class I [Paeniglutamicibacter kerguelensis]|uniref:mannose-6-phosphate isomerase n=1 Tax=Paeniglutamicibacter kerguelensis TaxID=254788 RepID=A0ABS4X8X0_9MICC|nr:mannose-6-phosphate isomerase, class I [Paeniglutamicibacter kerguelensis]MBP2384913.1 mannose-6-phosphate isomerase [Paeniglutamicibacter kerguelensis]
MENPLRNYPWGSRTLIAGLLGREPGAEPEAEMWIGAHPSAPSRVVSGVPGETPGLDELISANAEALLGSEVAGDGRSLPFLLKLLAAEKPLSIQVHPDAAQAAEGFAAENAAGIALDAPHRNYRDAAHKPEMIYALTDFAALSGFREPEQIARHFSLLLPLLSGVAADACAGIIELLGGEDALRNTFGRLLCGAPELTKLTARVLHAVRTEESLRTHPALAELPSLNAHYPNDPGILVSLMLNLVQLAPGQAIYLAAGNVHAYLRGLGVEVMANSDNVLRGGLTAKHIDLPELLRITVFEPQDVPLLHPRTTDFGQQVFAPPFDEFQLQHIELPAAEDAADMADADVPIAANGPVLMICVDGQLVVDTPRGDQVLHRGESLFIGAAEAPAMARRSVGSGARAFAVTVQAVR